MYKISCFADEISKNSDEQFAILKELKIHWLSMRFLGDTNVLDLTDEEVDEFAKKLSENGIGVSSIGSPIGKTSIDDDSDLYIKQTKRAVEIAKKVNCPRIRVFSFYVDKDKLDLNRDKVISRLKKMTEIAAAENIQLIHENEAGIYGESSERCADIIKSVNSPYFKAVFDPSNFVAAGEEPFEQSFKNVDEYIAYMHIKDSRHEDGVIVPAGEGDGRIEDIINALKDRDLFLTLEPHLSDARKMRGFTSPDLFRKDHNLLIKILNKLNIEYQ